MANDTNTRQRLIIASNRLPFNVSTEGGKLQFHESSGGLVTGLSSFLNSPRQGSALPDHHLWVGWPGATVEPGLTKELKEEALRRFHTLPVFLSQDEMDQFYFGFCNKTIWPLFHYFPSFTTYQENLWEQYKRVNRIFCDSLVDAITPNDIVWVHDYHLMLLPRLLKARVPNIRVGFFLHIPFPSFELFRLLPAVWRREILEGLLGANLIGFHTYEYGQHFLQSVLRILGYENHMGQIMTPERLVNVETFPMGIDVEKFAGAVHEPGVQRERKALETMFSGMKVILSVDRLDYTKGIINRLQGFEILLETYPQYRGKVVLVMVVVPSRIGVEQYTQMKGQIEELVGSVNGRFGTIGWTPVLYQFRHVPFCPLAALYSVSDSCLVTPLRDGMNLVAKEYVASRADGSGVLILSEMAGAAKELAEATLINPNNTSEIAEAMRESLEIPAEEQKRRMHTMQNRLRRYTVKRWADDFVQQLIGMSEIQERFCAKLLSQSLKRKSVEQYRKASRRILFLDYDGTLVPHMRQPNLARPGKEVLKLLQELSADRCNTVVLISGRDRVTMENWFGHIGTALVAEHGAWLKRVDEDWQMFKQHVSDWKPRLLPILEQYADRVPGAFVEEKEHSMVWHYRNADPDQGRAMAAELTDNLVNFTASIDLHVLQGSKIVEIRNAGIDKGTASREWLARGEFDFVLAVGDDWTDEDMFGAMPDHAISIKVGVSSTHARYNVRHLAEITKLLEEFVHRYEDEGTHGAETITQPGGPWCMKTDAFVSQTGGIKSGKTAFPIRTPDPLLIPGNQPEHTRKDGLPRHEDLS